MVIRMHAWMIILVIPALSLFYFLSFPKDSASHDANLQLEVQGALQMYRNIRNSGDIALADIVHKQIRKVCVQRPYDTIEDVERKFNEKIPSYTLLMEDQYHWWFFFSDGSVKWISVPVAGLMTLSPDSADCISTRNPIIHINMRNYSHGSINEYFLRGGQ